MSPDRPSTVPAAVSTSTVSPGTEPTGTEPEAVGRIARTVVAGARHALLTLPCEHSRGWVGLLDDGGEPVILAGAASPPALAAIAGGRAVLDVPGQRGERVVLVGELRPVRERPAQVAARLSSPERPVALAGDTAELTALALSVLEVFVCLPAEGATTGWAPASPGRRLDLASYALAEPDLVAAYATDLVAHLNATHPEEVRTLALGAGEPAVGELAGAQVTGLDRAGLDLWRVGVEGAEAVRITFRRPLAAPRDLGAELRRLLGRP